MTMIVVMLIGLGTIFIASALDCSDIQTTFQNIVSGKTIDWTGQSANCSGGFTPTIGGQQLGPGIHLPNPDGTCPKGTHPITSSGGKLLCQDDKPAFSV